MEEKKDKRGSHPNSKKNLVNFRDSDEHRYKGGRPKKIYTILKEKGYGKDDIRTAFQELAFYDMNELKNFENDTEKPIITRIVCKQFRLAFEEGNWTKIKEILEHSIGKPIQGVQAEVHHVEQPLFAPLTNDEENEEHE